MEGTIKRTKEIASAELPLFLLSLSLSLSLSKAIQMGVRWWDNGSWKRCVNLKTKKVE